MVNAVKKLQISSDFIMDGIHVKLNVIKTNGYYLVLKHQFSTNNNEMFRSFKNKERLCFIVCQKTGYCITIPCLSIVLNENENFVKSFPSKKKAKDFAIPSYHNSVHKDIAALC